MPTSCKDTSPARSAIPATSPISSAASSPPAEVREQIKGNKDMAEAFERMAEHLAANGVDIAKDHVTLGLMLTMDPKTERFVGNAKANESDHTSLSRWICGSGKGLISTMGFHGSL